MSIWILASQAPAAQGITPPPVPLSEYDTVLPGVGSKLSNYLSLHITDVNTSEERKDLGAS